MGKNKNSNKKELINNNRINKTKIILVTNQNKNNIDIEKDCKNFCQQYSEVSFQDYSIEDLKRICNEGQGLINTYFITCLAKEINQTIVRLEYIVSNASYTLNTKQIEKIKETNLKLSNNIRTTMHKARKLEKELKNKTRQIENVKNEQKSIITTIISIVLAISIIPTAVSGIQNINSNYILPFMTSIVLLGIIMISFTYSIYIERFKKRIAVFLILIIAICIGVWYMSFNFDISIQNTKEDSKNEIKNNEIILKKA